MGEVEQVWAACDAQPRMLSVSRRCTIGMAEQPRARREGCMREALNVLHLVLVHDVTKLNDTTLNIKAIPAHG